MADLLDRIHALIREPLILVLNKLAQYIKGCSSPLLQTSIRPEETLLRTADVDAWVFLATMGTVDEAHDQATIRNHKLDEDNESLGVTKSTRS